MSVGILDTEKCKIGCYCIFHMTLPPPQFHLHSWSIFEVLVLAQFLMDCLKSLCMVLYILNLDAHTSMSSNFCFLNFWFFILSSQGRGIKNGKFREVK